MAIDSDIRDQAYQFFIQEAPELLQVIETELLTLRQERSTAKIHNMMRAAHSIKGGASCVELETIKMVAHRLEDIFKALHHDELEIDDALESGLLQAYDCLRLPLLEAIATGEEPDAEQTIALAEPVFAQLEAQLHNFLGASANLPSSIELGVDIAASIFEVDVAEGMERMKRVLARRQNNEMAAELHAQAEVFAGIAELLTLPGFGSIATTVLAALAAHPDRALDIAPLALADFQVAQLEVLAGDRTQGGAPSPALTQFAIVAPISTHPSLTVLEDLNLVSDAALDDIALDAGLEDMATLSMLDELWGETAVTKPGTDSITAGATLDDVWSDAPVATEFAFLDSFGVNELDADALNGKALPVMPTALIEQMFVDHGLENQAIAPIELPSVTAEPNHLTDPLAAVLALDAIFGDLAVGESADPVLPVVGELQPESEAISQTKGDRVQALMESITQDFDHLPTVEAIPPLSMSPAASPVKTEIAAASSIPANYKQYQKPAAGATAPSEAVNQLSVRVNLDRLERMNNLVGELAINRNGLSLQNEQLQTAVQELLRRFAKFQSMGTQLRDLSDQMLIAPDRHSSWSRSQARNGITTGVTNGTAQLTTQPTSQQRGFYSADFDSLELDSYSDLHLLLQATLEEIAQLEETVGDIVLLSGQSNQTLEGQRQKLNHLRDDLMWARMLPLSEVLNRFPRTLRDLATKHGKPTNLKLSGTGVLIDKAVLEKLQDPLLHLLRNAFDHGIEPPEIRLQQGKLEQGRIEIRAYHRGSQTIIEIRDDGRGINLEKIRQQAIAMGYFTAKQAAGMSNDRLLNLLFEPGFSTASEVSDLSGRGVGLNVVCAQLQALKGTVTVASEPGQGTTFTLRIPLTLTIAKLLVCLVGATAVALPSDSIEEILIPKADQIKQSNGQSFLHWRNQLVPVQPLSGLLDYAYPLPESLPNQALVAVPTPETWAAPLLLLRQGDQMLALEIDRLVTEQELVIKPFGAAIAPPSYIYGCTILGDGSLVPVIDGVALFSQITASTQLTSPAPSSTALPTVTSRTGATEPKPTLVSAKTPTLLIVDDSIALRQTLALTLQKAGYRVLQARDGREAIEQLQQNTTIQLVICDIEMPNMNGFEFLTQRRQDASLSAIPVAMLTSRGSDKHRQLAMHLGASTYTTKPYIEREFLAMLTQILKPVEQPAMAVAT
ncbi:hybrid sensor histidine kinase/response regulator [Phormidium sp. FACHB-592]|uniref:histidine kinase n=1 Tax=Stenomitos frigidus AS-A4 TaxID=2933935 RepID=A0ABV0KN76_9CYAN|nr:hybrid sensor histidine kinase/response regulator [Phormidium sp. FACHB-592]MBD2073099.1 hybrid sensor histidine kinase/response regulator [Phormidium sp. FACHB-592]